MTHAKLYKHTCEKYPTSVFIVRGGMCLYTVGNILFLGLFDGASLRSRYVRWLQNVELTYKRQFARHAARIPSPTS